MRFFCVEKLLCMINNIVDNDFWVTARYLAKITGKIVSFSESLGSVCRFMTRQLHLTICFRRSWDTVLKLNKESIVELNFWRLNCVNLPFKKIFHNYVLPERLIYTDASDRSGAGFCTEILGKIVRRTWTKSEAWAEFYSKFVDGLSTGIDAFSFDWKFDNNWIVPPVRLISRVISHLIARKATGVLVAQKWTSSPFWSCIVNNDGTFKEKLSTCNKPTSYSRVRKLFRTSLDKIRLDKSKFGLHSLRSGGATSAANNSVADRLFKTHGRWLCSGWCKNKTFCFFKFGNLV